MIVSSSEELTPEWFTRALGDERSTVTDVRLDQVGSGAMCGMVRAQLTWDRADGGPGSVIVKLPIADAGTFALAKAMRMYELEVRFYRDLRPHLSDVRVPRSYFTALDEATGTFTLVLEDLS